MSAKNTLPVSPETFKDVRAYVIKLRNEFPNGGNFFQIVDNEDGTFEAIQALVLDFAKDNPEWARNKAIPELGNYIAYKNYVSGINGRSDVNKIFDAYELKVEIARNNRLYNQPLSQMTMTDILEVIAEKLPHLLTPKSSDVTIQ